MNDLHVTIRLPESLVPSLLHIGAHRIDKLTIRNDGNAATLPLELQMDVPGLSVPPVALSGEPTHMPGPPIRVKLPALKPGEEREITDIPLPLDYLDRVRLEALQNRDSGLPCRLQVLPAGRLVAEQQFSMLPPNAWAYREHPEALAAFVNKESRAVQSVRECARSHLNRHLGVRSFEAAIDRSLAELRLSSELERTEQIVCSLYECLLESFRIHYEREPRTYPEEWQKIRYHGRILGDHEGTCIDLALLTLACLEGVPLDPMLILIRTGPSLQHVLLACWEVESESPLPVITDHAQIQHWLGATSSNENKLLLWDPVGFATENGWPFSEACEAGRFCWQQAEPADFVCAVDLVQARKIGISPMPFGEGPHYSPEGWDVLREAEDLARHLKYNIVERGHLFLALLRRAVATSAVVLGEAAPEIGARLEARMSRKSPGKVVANPRRTDSLDSRLKRAQGLAEECGAGLVRPVQLWHALLEEPGETAARILKEFHVDTEEAIEKLRGLANDDPQRQSYVEWRTGEGSRRSDL